MPTKRPKSRNRSPLSLYSSLERVGATDAVVTRIESLILENQLRPGDPLPPERELAEGFGVGRNVVREALRSLAEKGLVEVRAGRGTVVVEADPSAVTESLRLLLRRRRVTLEELGDARLLIEPELAALAAKNAPSDDTRVLEECLRKLEVAGDDSEAHVQADLDLHHEIARLSNQLVLQAIFDAIQAVMLWSMRLGITIPGAAAASDDRHRRIVAAIVAGDADTAREEMRTHMLTVAEYASLGSKPRNRKTDEGKLREA